MRTPLSWLNLIHNKVRTALAIAGVAFAVILMFMQLGFYRSAERSATLIYDALDFQILLRSRHYLHFVESHRFHRDRLLQAASVSGVTGVSAFYVGNNQWNPERGDCARAILVLGFNPLEPVFKHAEIRKKSRLLTVDQYLLIDSMSRPEFLPADGKRFGEADIGTEVELGARRVRIAGCFELGTGFAADGAVLMSARGFARVQPGRTRDDVSFGLVRLERGADADEVAEDLRNQLGGEVEVVTREELRASEAKHWIWKTPIGVIFAMGLVLAMVVGTAIVYLILSNDVANHLAEYATLKAMGYSGGYLVGVVLQQAIALAFAGFLPGIGISVALYWVTSAFARLPIKMEWLCILFVLGLTVVMCVASGVAALRKLRAAEPADLF